MKVVGVVFSLSCLGMNESLGKQPSSSKTQAIKALDDRFRVLDFA